MDDGLRFQIRELIRKKKLVKRYVGIAAGETIEQVVNGQGETLDLPPEVGEQRRAIEYLLDRGFGKPEQSGELRIEDATGRPSAEELIAVRDRLRGNRT
jgi:hypothetical protein